MPQVKARVAPATRNKGSRSGNPSRAAGPQVRTRPQPAALTQQGGQLLLNPADVICIGHRNLDIGNIAAAQQAALEKLAAPKLVPDPGPAASLPKSKQPPAAEAPAAAAEESAEATPQEGAGEGEA